MNGIDHVMAKVDTAPEIIDDIFKVINDNTVWTQYHDFDAKPIHMEIMKADPFLSWLSDRYEFIGGVLKIKPFSQYDWHVDENRGVAINMLLSHTNSFVMFSDRVDALVRDILPLNYDIGSYYLFNTQVPHSVVNFAGDRYLFTLEFARDKNSLTYAELYNDVFKNYYAKQFILDGENNEQIL